MKNITKYLTILLLLSVALTSIVYIGSSNVTATGFVSTPTPIPTPTTVPSFFDCVFGVHIIPGADPMGVYSVNNNPNYVNARKPTPTPTTGTITGTIYRFGGVRPFTNAIIGYQDNSGIHHYPTQTASDGTYTISDIPAGFLMNFEAYYPDNTHPVAMGGVVRLYAGQTLYLNLTAFRQD